MSILTNAQMKLRVSKDLSGVEEYLQASLTTGAEDFNALIRPLSAGGGKRLRAQLCLLIALAGDSKQEDRIRMAGAIEMLHLATLIHDDVLDQAEVRRGVESIHCSKGNKVAILSGDYLFAKAFSIVAEVGSIPCLTIFSEIITALVEGEFMQMEDVYRLDQGTDRYLLKTQKKTADFIEGCLAIGGILGGWSEEHIQLLRQYGHGLGMAFQITDDVMDYREQTVTTGKPVGKDVKEGILTYPLLSVVTDETRSTLEDMIADIKDGADTKELLDYVTSLGGIDKALALEAQYRKEAEEALRALPSFKGKDILETVLEKLATRKV